MKFVSMPNWMVGVVAFGSVVAHTAVLLVFQLGQPRIFFAMARDGLLPKAFAKVHPKFRTPHVTTILTGVFVGVTAMFTSLDDMVNLTNIGTLFAFILICLGIIILRYREPDRERPVPRSVRTAAAAGARHHFLPGPHLLPSAVFLVALRRLARRRPGDLRPLRLPAQPTARD